jgi:hypothetical protein
MHGFVAQEASGAFGMPESVEQSYKLLIDAVDLALTKWPKGTKKRPATNAGRTRR